LIRDRGAKLVRELGRLIAHYGLPVPWSLNGGSIGRRRQCSTRPACRRSSPTEQHATPLCREDRDRMLTCDAGVIVEELVERVAGPPNIDQGLSSPGTRVPAKTGVPPRRAGSVAVRGVGTEGIVWSRAASTGLPSLSDVVPSPPAGRCMGAVDLARQNGHRASREAR
jgi:hypothetical protein